MQAHRAKLTFASLAIFLIVIGIVVWSPGLRAGLVQAAIAGDPTVQPLAAPPGYRIVYLSSEGAIPAESLIAPSRFADVLGAETAHTWPQVAALNDATPVGALVIHDSALAMVDQKWLAAAYQGGVVIATFNVRGPDLAALVGDPCVAEDKFASGQDGSSFFVVISHLTLAEDPDDLLLFQAAENVRCRDEEAPMPEGIKGLVSMASGRTTNSLKTDNDFNIFAQALVRHLDSIKRARQEFDEGELIRTPNK